MIRSLRNVEPITSFRSTFAYTNLTHVLAQHVIAQRLGAKDWDGLVRETIFEPLGMTSSSFTAEAIEAAPDHSQGHRWTPDGTIEVPFTQIFPYNFGAAGAINSTVEDLAPWVRLHLAGGVFDGKRLVSAENLAVTKTARVGITDTLSYAMGWVIQTTPNGRIIWHNGGTPSFGAFIGTAPDKDIGVIVLTNETNVGFPDAVGEWVLDRLMDNPVVDHAAAKLAAAKAGFRGGRGGLRRAADPPPVAPARRARRRLFQSEFRCRRRRRRRRCPDGRPQGDRRHAALRAAGRRSVHRHARAERRLCGGGRQFWPAAARLRTSLGRQERPARPLRPDGSGGRPGLHLHAAVTGHGAGGRQLAPKASRKLEPRRPRGRRQRDCVHRSERSESSPRYPAWEPPNPFPRSRLKCRNRARCALGDARML